MRFSEEVYPTTIDDHVYPEGGTLGPRVQTSLQLFYVYSGHSHVFVDEVERYVGPEEITLLLPGHIELFRFARSEKTHHGYCSIWDIVLSEEQTRDYQRLTKVFPVSAKIRELTDWAKSLNACMDRSTRILHDQIAHLLFCEFFRIAGYPEEPVSFPDSVLRAKRLVDLHYDQPLDLNQMAQAACVTPTHLIRLFRQHLNVTPVEYLWRTRTESSIRLLVDTGLSISEIAYRCGFNAPYHFVRRFKARYDMTPGAYRREKWKR